MSSHEQPFNLQPTAGYDSRDGTLASHTSHGNHAHTPSDPYRYAYTNPPQQLPAPSIVSGHLDNSGYPTGMITRSLPTWNHSYASDGNVPSSNTPDGWVTEHSHLIISNARPSLELTAPTELLQSGGGFTMPNHVLPTHSQRFASVFDISGQSGPYSPTITSRTASTSSLKAPRSRVRHTQRTQQHSYLDSILRSKCPKEYLPALNEAIRFRDDHDPTDLIPNEILGQLLEESKDEKDKYYCFCCPRARKARTITPARDHVRKSLGNFPFQCPNEWCQHSSLRQADLNKHRKTCINPDVPA